MKAQDMDELLGTNARLAIVLTLADGKPWIFTDLREETGLADGNLHVQTGKLVVAGYLDTEKTRRGKRLVTAFQLTRQGRQKLAAHVQRLGRALGLRGLALEDQNTGNGFAQASKKQDRNDDSQVW